MRRNLDFIAFAGKIEVTIQHIKKSFKQKCKNTSYFIIEASHIFRISSDINDRIKVKNNFLKK